ncbi:cytochrome P450 [Allorhizocola rhizosphaerae]|uniref:cytochrome P450 n=1 Tax=Allorhizocola rhizosphaerae TaxID=1872709 RepID=UPI000E3C348D|nr:cytochrome P450 [Allorhizocola rhizosphaerae]
MLIDVDAALTRLPPQYFDPAQPAGLDERTQTFSLYSYDDVVRLLTDRTSFTSDYGINEADLPNLHPAWAGMWATDGQRHEVLRSAVADPFRPGYLAWLEPRVRDIAVELIEATPESGPYDITDLARVLPSRVICLILDLPMDATERVMGWIDETSAVTSVAALPSQPEMAGYFREMINQQKRRPGHGLLGELVRAQANGAPLSDWDLLGYAVMLLSAAIDTTTTVICNALLFLSEYGHAEKLAAEPELVGPAIEEVLRWYPPFPAQTRISARELELNGVTIPRGTPVSGYLSAANRDPVRFPDPDRFDPARSPNPHLSFGRGKHFCLGAALARLELNIAVREMLARRPRLRWDRTVPLERHHGAVHRLTRAVFQMG